MSLFRVKSHKNDGKERTEEHVKYSIIYLDL